MFLEKLKLYQFKNHANLELNFSEKVVCILGNNGVGKTNVLDAIYYLSVGKSFFNAQDAHNISYGKNEFSVKGVYFDADKEKTEILCSTGVNRKKTIKKNDKPYKRIADHLGLLPVVFISPTDVLLLIEGSETRRKFLDAFIAQTDKNYLQHLISYQKLLLHRNTLLKKFKESNYTDFDTLSIYDEQLIDLNQKIHSVRLQFTNDFKPYFINYYQQLSGKANEQINLVYESQLNNVSMTELFSQNKQKDVASGYTNAGIHKDDLLFLKDNRLIKKSGSQGQQKTYLLAMKLAQIAYLNKHINHAPVLLLDDIFDKLDENRLANLLQMINNENPSQIFITDTHLTRIPEKLQQLNILHQVIDLQKHTSNNE